MSFGTLALILATYTPIFNWLSLPFGYYLKFLGLEEAFAAAPSTIIGFADMFIPAILSASIVSYKTRFVIWYIIISSNYLYDRSWFTNSNI